MRRIVQRDRNGCGVACVAIIVGATYEEIRQIIFGKRRGSYTTTRQLRNALRRFGFKISTRITPTRGSAYRQLQSDAILKVNVRKKSGYWHWVIWDARRNRIIDPDWEPARRHIVRGYLIITDIAPRRRR